MNAREILKLFLPPIVTKIPHGRAPARNTTENIVGSYQRDEFLTWLNYITPGMLRDSNLALIDYSIKHMPKTGAVVEIGSFAGLSLNHAIHMMKQAAKSNPVISVDGWQFEGMYDGLIPGSTVSFSDYRKHVIDIFKNSLILFHPNTLPHHVMMNSNEFFDFWAKGKVVTDFFGRETTLGGPIAMAYIDGAHSYEQSKLDFENVDKFLSPGGFVVFDDSGDNSEWGSRLTAAEAANLPNYELIAKNPNYCVRKLTGTPL